ncbi:MAG: hypothetical protein ACPGU7_02380 [Gammaproteobacteria bacterium]
MTLEIPVAALQLDRREWREQAGEGFESSLSAKDIARTRRNMLGDQVLHGGAFPSVRVTGYMDGDEAVISIRVRDATHRYRVPVRVEQDGEAIRVSGSLTMYHADFGLTPFSALFGALRVEPRIDARFSLVWVRPGSEPIPPVR